MQDYYFSAAHLRIMDAIQGGSLHTRMDAASWKQVLPALEGRASYESPDLVEGMKALKGQTYREFFDRGLAHIARTRKAEQAKWIGFKDLWVIEFFSMLARAYPSARFIVIMRDPRAVVASNLGFAKIDPSQVGHPLSLGRHWRKYAAFIEHYQQDPLFAGRLLPVSYEQLVTESETAVQRICDFLEISYEERMLDTSNYFDYSTGRPWQGNSTFQQKIEGLNTDMTARWRTKLSPDVVDLIDLICGPDMHLHGYTPRADFREQLPPAHILAHLIESGQGTPSWRSDFEDVQRDYGYELFRRALLACTDAQEIAPDLIRKSFLFEEVYSRLQPVPRMAAAA